MLIIICSKSIYESDAKISNCTKRDEANELNDLIDKYKKIYIISPKISQWKLVSGSLLLLAALILVFENYQALAAICFIVGFTLVLYDWFLKWCNYSE